MELRKIFIVLALVFITLPLHAIDKDIVSEIKRYNLPNEFMVFINMIEKIDQNKTVYESGVINIKIDTDTTLHINTSGPFKGNDTLVMYDIIVNKKILFNLTIHKTKWIATMRCDINKNHWVVFIYSKYVEVDIYQSQYNPVLLNSYKIYPH